jgi:hypothetical protein
MTRWPLRYQFLRRRELEAELIALCLRLQVSRPPIEPLAQPAAGGAEAASDVEASALRRCYISSKGYADLDFPRLLETDERVRALMGTLNEVASLLHRLARSERSGRGRHFRS